MKKFLIIYIGRCGSTYLQTLLNSHPNICCMGELLHPGINRRYNKVGLPMINNPSVYDDEANFPTSADIVFQERIDSTKYLAGGFKLSIMHFFGNVNAIDRWIRESGAVCIHIKRNLLDLYISMKLAQINKTWTSKDGAYTDYKIKFDLDDFKKYATDWELYDKELSKIAIRTGGISTSYEALEMHTQLICNYIISNILDIKNTNHIFTSDLNKQCLKSITEILV